MKVIDSVAGHARKKVRELQRVNPALRGARSPAWLRILGLFPGERTLFALCGIYGVFFTLLVIAGALLRLEPPLALAEELKALAEPDTGRNLLSYMLGAQATMVGLIFPLALGLVTLIVQRDEGASTNVDVQLYYHESRAYAVGTSGLTLALLLLAELGRPEAFLLRILDSPQTTGSISLSLVLLLGVWLMANLLLTWQFLTTSLSFIRPAFRMASRQRYVAAAVIPPICGRSSQTITMSISTASTSRAQKEIAGHSFCLPPPILCRENGSLSSIVPRPGSCVIFGLLPSDWR